MIEIAPVRRSKAEARATYDRRSRGYERMEGRFERRARITGERQLTVSAGERVLEIGSGPGASLVAFARAVGPKAVSSASTSRPTCTKWLLPGATAPVFPPGLR